MVRAVWQMNQLFQEVVNAPTQAFKREKIKQTSARHILIWWGGGGWTRWACRSVPAPLFYDSIQNLKLWSFPLEFYNIGFQNRNMLFNFAVSLPCNYMATEYDRGNAIWRECASPLEGQCFQARTRSWLKVIIAETNVCSHRSMPICSLGFLPIQGAE